MEHVILDIIVKDVLSFQIQWVKFMAMCVRGDITVLLLPPHHSSVLLVLITTRPEPWNRQIVFPVNLGITVKVMALPNLQVSVMGAGTAHVEHTPNVLSRK